MREILFRGKRIDNSEWVTGVPWIFSPPVKKAIIVYAMGLVGEDDDVSRYCESYEVDPETVGQYTGLTDKNGKKIFEGDIVFNNMAGRKLIGYLEERAAFCFCDKCITSPAFIGQYNFEYFEVIGNIHDNPELLEVEE